MHPDAIITGLRQELERLDPKADDHEERKAAIHAEIKRVDALPRPAVTPEHPDTVLDHSVGYLAALKQELERSPKDRHDEIKAEIARVEQAIHDNPDAQPTGDEVALTDPVVLDDLTKAQLLEHAETAGVPVSTGATKADILKLLVPDAEIPAEPEHEGEHDQDGEQEPDSPETSETE